MRSPPGLLGAFLVCILTALSPATEEGERNLVGNPSFDLGADGATKIPGWTEVDELTTFFEPVEGRGRVLRIDTDVKLGEANERWEEMALPPEERPAPRPKGPTHPPKYDTVGGTTGTKIYSDYFRVEPGMRYRLSVDVNTAAPTVKIFIKGYARFQGGYRKYYQCYKNVEGAKPGWKTYVRTFNPTVKSPDVTHIRVMPYAYWPPGDAWVDNISITRIGPDRPRGAATESSLLVNGDFEAKELAPWSAEGAAERVVRGAEGACARVGAGGTLTSDRVGVDSDRTYRMKLRVLPAGAVLQATVEGVVRFGGEWVPMFTTSRSAPPAGEGWVEMEFPFHPTGKTPQVTHVRARFKVLGEKGAAFVDDVAIELVKDERDE